MKRNFWSFFVLILIGWMASTPLFGQPLFHIGMRATEFSAQNPGILPDEQTYSKQLALSDTLQTIQGTWNFGVFKNRLVEAQFHGQSNIRTEAEFNPWVKSAGQVVEAYTKIFGEPSSYFTGSNQFTDPKSREYEGIDGQREIFHEAVWVKSGMRIRLNCDFGTYHTAEKPEYFPNAPQARSSYEFSIGYSRIPTKMEPKPIEGCEFWLGMSVLDFARAFPQLFPNGVQMTGQWQQSAIEKGLEGEWTFDFEADKLTHAAFRHYSADLSSNSAISCIQGTEEIIDSLQDRYGKPDDFYARESESRGATEKQSISLRMREANWYDAKGMKISVECTQYGGKSEPQLTVSMVFTAN